MTNDEAIPILNRIANGDSQEALTRFYQAYAGGIFAMLIRILGVRSEAEELLQDIFVELWKRAPQYDPERASVKTWVVQIARSRAIDRIRARNSRGAGKHVDIENVTLRSDVSHGPEAAATASRVQVALENLPQENREALALSYFGGLSHREIADYLGIPLGTIKSRILAGMKRLRQDFLVGGQRA